MTELKSSYHWKVIGAFFTILSLADKEIERAFFISPIVDMKKLIQNMMEWAGVTTEELQKKGEIPTDFGETLSWKYYSYVCKYPVKWEIPTCFRSMDLYTKAMKYHT